MLHSLTFDERQTDPRANLDANVDGFSASDDTTLGLANHVAVAHTNGDFASGMRTLIAPRVVGDFASGMRTLARTTTVGDFATGMRTLPRTTTLGDFATGMRGGSALVVMNAFTSAVSELSMPREVNVA